MNPHYESAIGRARALADELGLSAVVFREAVALDPKLDLNDWPKLEAATRRAADIEILCRCAKHPEFAVEGILSGDSLDVIRRGLLEVRAFEDEQTHTDGHPPSARGQAGDIFRERASEIDARGQQ